MTTTDAPAGRLLSVAQAAEILGVSRGTAYAMVREQALPAIRFRGVIRIPAAALESWLAEMEQEAFALIRTGGPAP